jgi:hypothetical protein
MCSIFYLQKEEVKFNDLDHDIKRAFTRKNSNFFSNFDLKSLSNKSKLDIFKGYVNSELAHIKNSTGIKGTALHFLIEDMFNYVKDIHVDDNP